MYDDYYFDDLEQLRQVCEFITDMVADTNIVARPGDHLIVWYRRFPGHGEYQVGRKEAYYLLGLAGYNPRKLIEFAKDKYKL